MQELTFDALRIANTKRLPQFKNSKGEPAHEKADGSDWSLAEWMNAVAGELGEAANIIKKIRRGDITLEDARPMLAKEFADIVTYLDITAMQAGINLGQATITKFNEVSNRVGSDVTINPLIQAERIFTEHDIAQLQTEVHQITGNGPVMALFNKLLGVAAC